MRAPTLAGALMMVLLWWSPGLCEQTGKHLECRQVPDICKHLTAKYGDKFSPDEGLSEVRVPELEPFIPHMLFYLTNVRTGESKWYAVDLLAARSLEEQHRIVSSGSPLFRPPDPEFLGLFEGVTVEDPARRADYAYAVAKVLEEMTYAGSVTDSGLDGSTAVAKLTYKGTPLSQVRVQFGADGRVQKVDAMDLRKQDEATSGTGLTAEDLEGKHSVSDLVKALTKSGLSRDAHPLTVSSDKRDAHFSIEQDESGPSIEILACGHDREPAGKVVTDLAATHGLAMKIESKGQCSEYVLLGDLSESKVLGSIVSRICKEIMRLHSGSKVSVSAVP